jgi:protein arginine N-methyltransferase 1
MNSNKSVRLKKRFGLSLQTHRVMLEDKKRILSYKKAIENCAGNGKVFLDLGCGTGIMSFFATRKNIKKIYAVDKDARMIGCAKKTAELNGLDKKIAFIKSDIKNFKPKEKIDVLIHELIGDFLWDEDMVSSIRYIRDNHMSRSGVFIPKMIKLYLAPVNYQSALEKNLSFWRKIKYGINFAGFAKEYLAENIDTAMVPSHAQLHNTQAFLSKAKLGYVIDFKKEMRIPRKIEVTFKINKADVLNGVCAFLKVILDKKNQFSRGPQNKNTHWGQIFLPSPASLNMKMGNRIKFTFFPKKHRKDWRWKLETLPTCA